MSGAEWFPETREFIAVLATTVMSPSWRICREPLMSARDPGPAERKVIMAECHCMWAVFRVKSFILLQTAWSHLELRRGGG